MKSTAIVGASLALLLAVACGGSGSVTAPTSTPSSGTSTAAPPVAGFPAPVGPARAYTFASELSYPVREWTRSSRFLLYENGAFALEYAFSRGSSEYRGAYSVSNGIVTFRWEGWSAAGPWGATGEIDDDSLTVHYNFIMELSDFENAIYRRTSN